MTVVLTVSKTLNGTAVNDTLAGAGTNGTGVDLGAVTNGSYTNVTGLAGDNEGQTDLYIRHDAVQDPITDCKTFIQAYLSTLTSPHSYGGPSTSSPAADLTRMFDLADASGNSKDNSDGLSGGLWVDMDASTAPPLGVSSINQFDYATNGFDGTTSAGGNDTVAKYGDNGAAAGYGSDLANAILISSEAMVYDSDPGAGVTEALPSSPADGVIGLNESATTGDTGVTAGELAAAAGSNAHIKLRMYLPSSFNTGGIHQFEYVIAYSFTA